jgi:proline dehydrogenase
MLQALGENDDVLYSERSSQPNREMSSVRTISGQNNITVVPALITDILEIQPPGCCAR